MGIFRSNQPRSARRSGRRVVPMAALALALMASGTQMAWADHGLFLSRMSVNDVRRCETVPGIFGAWMGFTVTLDHHSTATSVTVNWATENLTAVAPGDYTASSGTLSFGPGVTSRVIVVPITADSSNEPNQQFTVKLSGVTGPAFIGDSTGTGTILDDDPAKFHVDDAAGGESSGSMAFKVSRCGDSSSNARVDYGTQNGTALAGSDYLSKSGTLSFAAGETSKVVQVPLVNNSLHESTESFTVLLSNPVGAFFGDGIAKGTIYDDDIS
jgi:hypothetical protein